MILIIDDDADHGELTRQRLEAVGIAAILQVGPFGSLAAMRRGEFELVILDVNMPALSGVKILELLRGGDGSSARVMLYSCMDGDALGLLAREHGADAWLPKTASRSELLRTVRALTGR